ncbi:hypothetical protein BDZ89DRAFT_1093230 [Hymenopellis radicata]|nr:hypothetical protein BDZ89DRAFT_1093230 [Hymenopellis radicata]
MKGQLRRRGGASTLNIYSVGFDYAGNPSDDGIVILHSSLPGGTTRNYNEGQNATHEVGHWVGLYHTFQGGCFGSGDEVADTPAEGTPTSGCPKNKDTCILAPGVDPIRDHYNYMDYSDDACMTEFTPAQMRTYRGVDA